MSVALLPAFSIVVRTPWLLPQVIGNGLQYEFTRDQYWLGSGLTDRANVLSDTRASNALFDNTAGVYSAFAPNVPAITDRGLYPGGQVAPMLLSSANLANGTYWLHNNVSAIQNASSPDGQMNAATLTETTSTTNHQVGAMSQYRPNGAALTLYTAYVFVSKVQTRRYVVMWWGAAGDGILVTLDTQTGIITEGVVTGGDYTIDAYGVEDAGSFWRVWSTGSKATAFVGGRIVPVLSGAVAATGNPISPVYTGNGSTIIAWDFNVMQTSFLPPPVPTLGSKTPRIADSIVNPNFAAHAAAFGFASGMASLARVNLTRLSDGATRRIVSLGNTTDGAYIEFTSTNTFMAILRKGGVDVVTLTSGTVSAPSVYDVTVQFKPGDYSLTVSGGITGATSASAETLPAAIASAGYIGQAVVSTAYLNGPLERLAMWGVAA